VARGKLIGGHTGIAELENLPIALSADDFEGAILFVEDIPEFFTPDSVTNFFRRLGNAGFLQELNGVIIGKICEYTDFGERGNAIIDVISNKFGLKYLPVLYGLNFGHSSPICVIPYGAEAEINCQAKSFAILEPGVV
jgi:muramoyltetrapeptide carboxypeptidase LdcA involved in peptidoglycan recycling